MSTRFQLASVIFMMMAAVLFGLGIIPVLTLPSLAAHAPLLIPVAVVASIVLGAPLAWFIAPRIIARYRV